ncbi:R3H and coiled-coil domain-containing protein 1 [Entelurus aequoreus]|uniref:R3H and coiled-coil domain-containing protein 1 n=1 Tax=Entelurus aequoreus TaxID=161455 RepID=UPI002B1D9600|nr:R3H and coiled-coil domain-containing protein 1 [Entelurus aequoreus]XP_061900251.1 R3H and coiled-coil domain-containing protein 1 [Entelurus aequoreus]XP_061900260.1 R3H and coiled-coil domain-containing protein 1 [Entelurus aequoreus]
MAFPCFDGVYLPKEENEFVHQVLTEVETYQESSPDSVLLFPPLPSRLRYLIHRTMEDLPELTTFSVGESWWRRVVVCPCQLRGALEVDNDVESNYSLDEEPVRTQHRSSPSARSKAPRRPDKELYIPKAARSRPQPQQEFQRPASSHPSKTCSPPAETTDKSPSLVLKEESVPHATDGALGDDPPGGGEANVTLSDEEGEILHWGNTLRDISLEDNGEEQGATCDLTQEIKEHLKDGATFSVMHVHKDYSAYEKVLIKPEHFDHVIEIYDFPPVFKTEDLRDALFEYSDGGLKITWVDDTHALGVFSTEEAALKALSMDHPLLKVRRLAEGSKKAQGKAIRRAEFIQPVKERPKTDSAVARRMVARALGLKGRGRGRGQNY